MAILDAGRNSMSFFLLLVVSLGLSVVRESLGRTMLKCQILTGLHFFFGSMQLASCVVLCMPNMFRSSSVWCWHRRVAAGIDIGANTYVVHRSTCVYSQWIPPVDYVLLEWCVAIVKQIILPFQSYFIATIAHLRARKQRYKLKMFQRLHLVLLFAVTVVIAFFVVSSMSFSGRFAEGT